MHKRDESRRKMYTECIFLETQLAAPIKENFVFFNSLIHRQLFSLFCFSSPSSCMAWQRSIISICVETLVRDLWSGCQVFSFLPLCLSLNFILFYFKSHSYHKILFFSCAGLSNRWWWPKYFRFDLNMSKKIKFA